VSNEWHEITIKVLCDALMKVIEVELVDVIFFFQAEDGIRDRNVTGVQTCALPISRNWNESKLYSRHSIRCPCHTRVMTMDNAYGSRLPRACRRNLPSGGSLGSNPRGWEHWQPWPRCWS